MLGQLTLTQHNSLWEGKEKDFWIVSSTKYNNAGCLETDIRDSIV